MQWIRRVAVIVSTAVVLGGGLAGAIGISGDGIEQDDIVAADRGSGSTATAATMGGALPHS
jgi:hypothetical protein